MKKIIFCVLILIIIIVIGLKVNYKSNIILSFGNNIKGDYIYYYNDTRVDDMIDDIARNIKIEERNIQNILIKANYIYIDLNNLRINKYSFNQVDNLLQQIRFYTKEKIIVVLRNENTTLDKTINKWIFQLSYKYDIMVKR